MKCPNCGEELKEDYLYCEKCGADIHIVPDFDPTIEYNIHKNLAGIVEEVAQQTNSQDNREMDVKKNINEKRHCKTLLILCSLAVLVLLTMTIIGGVIRQRYNSVDYQLKEALSYLNQGKEAEAVIYYERAVDLDGENASIRLKLAEVYGKLGEETLYLNQLKTVATSTYATENEVEQAYTKVIGYYKAKEDYEAINQLLLQCNNPNVLNANQSYMAKAPEFSYQEGVYAEVVPLKLTSNATGIIYYTLDGTKPDQESEIYTSPIFLDTGDYEVSSMFVNEYGIASEVLTKKYHIDVIKPAAPTVQVYSGEYTYPVMITVDEHEGTVYYTTDGSIPTELSLEYVAPIPMPLGKSTYRFVLYTEEGVAGDVTDREFELEINTELTVSDAQEAIVSAMIERDKIYDAAGHSSAAPGKYLYHFQYALAVPDAGDYYIISEIYEDTAGVRDKTGTDYAFNVYTGEVYRLLTYENGDYLLEVF